ncbi:hypothetical protein Tco_1490949 [Tanacetum coccineum]
MSIWDQTPIPFLFAAEVDRFLTISTLPPSPLTSYSSSLPQIPSPPLLLSSPLPVSPPPLPASPTYPLGYRAVMIRASVAMMRAVATFTYILSSRSETQPSGTPPLLPIPIPTSSPPLLLPSTDYRTDVAEVTLPPRKRLCISLGLRFEGTPAATDVVGLSQRMIDFVTTIRQDTDEIYRRLYDAHDDRSLMSGQLNLLRRDRRAHARTTRLVESEARISHVAWVQSMDANDTARSEVIALPSQQGPARGPAHPDVPEEADSSS